MLHLKHRIPKLLTSAHWPALLHSGLFFQNLWKQVTDVITKYVSLGVWEECTFVSYTIWCHCTPTASSFPNISIVVVVVQWISRVLLFVTPWTAVHQTSLLGEYYNNIHIIKPWEEYLRNLFIFFDPLLTRIICPWKPSFHFINVPCSTLGKMMNQCDF